MVQFLCFHHKERPWWGYHIKPPYVKGSIIEVYADGEICDTIKRNIWHDWGYLRIVRVKGDLYYDEAVKYKGRVINFKLLPEKEYKNLRKTGMANIYKQDFYKALQGVENGSNTVNI